MDIFGVTVQCGSVIVKECKDLALPWGEEWTFQELLNQIFDVTGQVLKLTLDALGEMPENIIRSLNAM
jgi:hypothetical protein